MVKNTEKIYNNNIQDIKNWAGRTNQPLNDIRVILSTIRFKSINEVLADFDKLEVENYYDEVKRKILDN